MNDQRKTVIYLGSSEKDLAKLPSTVREVFQHGIQMASEGDTHPDAKVLKGFHGRRVLELILSELFTQLSFQKFSMFFMYLRKKVKKEAKRLKKIESL